MRRAIAAIAGTTVGLVLLLGYKSGPVRPAPRAAAAAAPPPTTAGGDKSIGPLPDAPPTTQAAPATPARPAPTTTAPTAPATKDQTVTGPVVSTRYGDVQVQVTLKGGKLTNVSAVELPSDRSRSREISSTAAPVLRSEALAAQGAQIDGVSGATYTSDGYAQSLQAALDQARPTAAPASS